MNSATIIRIWHGLCSRIRIFFYRARGMQIGNACRLEAVRVRRPEQIILGTGNSFTAGTWLYPIDEASPQPRIRIGNGNFFNRDCFLDACNHIEIGDHNMFGPGVYIADSNHTMEPGKWVAQSPMARGRVKIGNGCWVGAKAMILKDVELGDRCIVGAGAVVTKSVPAGATVVGIPARPVTPKPNGPMADKETSGQ